MRPTQYYLLLIEDESTLIEALKLTLPKHWSLTARRNWTEELETRFFHCAFVDLHLSGDDKGPNGLEVIRKLSSSFPTTEIYAISGKHDLSLMEKTLEAGARGFVQKPLDAERVAWVLSRTESLVQLRDLQERPKAEGIKWIGQSPLSQNLLRQIAGLKGSTHPILISGETGSGKEVVARLINQQEAGRPFVAVNVAAIPENLFEAEFFGSTKGAFTGADSHRPGLVEAAAHGDLFLDEIEALPLELQAKLLRFLDLGEFRKVGGRETQKVSVRILAASNEDLKRKVSEGQFREDLLYRLQGTEIQVPPLRERLDDLPLLAEHFLKSCTPNLQKSWSPDAFSAMKTHSWPGNVRELKRCVEHVHQSSPLPIIRGVDLTPLLSLKSKGKEPSVLELDLGIGLENLVKNYEAHIITRSLKECASVDEAADLLKVSRSGLYKKIKEYGIQND